MLKNNPIINLFRYAWKYSFRTKGLFVLFITLSVIANGIGIMEPLVVGRVFNAIQFSGSEPQLLRHIVVNLSLLVLITLGFWIFHGLSRVIECRNAFLVRKNYKQDMFDQTLDLPAEWHKNHHSGDTIDKINKASEALFNFSQSIFMIVQNAVGLVGAIIILMLFDSPAVIISAAGSLIAFWTITKFDQKLKRGYKKVFKAENYLATGIHDYISNIMTVITLRLKPKVIKVISDRSMRAFSIFNKNNVINELKWFTTNLYITVMIVGVLILNAYRSYTIDGVILIGTLFTLYKYLSGIGEAFYTFAWRYGEIVREDTAVRAAEVLTESYQKYGRARAEKYHLPPKWQVLKINSLFFNYKEKKAGLKDSHSIENISMEIGRGKRIALIGESGSGKSTMLALMRGLHQPKRVKVLADGRELKHGLAHIYSSVTLIPQDPEIFNSTVLDNITMGTAVTKLDLERAIQMARLERVIARMPHGLNTNVMEKGVSLSGGEKQRLALARGLLAGNNYNFILMDEPTSSVDSHNEYHIYEQVFAGYPDKTIISAVHRLHLLRLFDYIYYFKDGRVIAQGAFEELLERSQEFKMLWENYSRKTKGRESISQLVN